MSSDEDDDYTFDESDYDEGPKKKVTKSKKEPAAKREPAAKKATKPKAKEAKETKAKDTKVKAKKSPAKKKRGDDSEEEEAPTKKKTKTKGQDRTYEETYQKKTPLEHILDRPDTYVGSVERQDYNTWVFDEDTGMNQRTISFVPALYKIFDEILVNAADNYQRDDSMDQIKVTINAEKNIISVWNNGQGIPVAIHSEHGVYIPEMIFGQLLTSSNYDDSVAKVTGGRNGYGAKLTNIFSTEFTVETSHLSTKKKFKQVFRNNMYDKEEPDLDEADDKDFTKITFKPDLARFKMTELDKDIVALMTKRVYDVAGCNAGIKVFLNGKRLPVKDFKSYVELYLPEDSKPVFEKVNDRWEVAVSVTDGGEFQQVSFVNSICTVRGGTHVKYVADKVVKHVQEAAMKKNKGGIEVKTSLVKNHLWVFVKALIENPAFDSQTKETLTTKTSAFGSKCELTEDFLKKVLKSDIITKVLEWSKFQEKIALGKKTGKKRGRPAIAKLDDAINAGTKHAQDCTLIVVEGESAKTNVVAGLGVVGRDNFGAYPLRGKLLNVRDSTFQSINKNQEIAQLTTILGLEHGKQYTDTSTLRYGHLMFMTDQDHDGSHIKGLLINFIHCFWPGLLRIPGYLTEFVTPIVKAHKKKQDPKYFYTMPEFKEWMDTQPPRHGYEIKYLKGLGTSKPEEFVQFMEAINEKRIDFSWTGEDDERAIDMAFNKKLADDRKKWLGEFKPGTFLDQTASEITYSDFINKELILFSLADCERSIPTLTDGFKPSQRKVVYTCLKINMKKETKFLVLTGEVQKACAYHHGDASLHSTIIGLAHNFVGSNNVNLLEPDSSIGSRRGGGTDAAAPRYLSTRLCEITRAIYRRDDDPLLEHLADDGKLVEPRYFVPVIPMVLVNGATGIGTGWSTTIPCYNPRDIIDNLKRLMKGEPQELLHPWYAGFKGKITADTKTQRYKVSGIWKRVDSKTVEITELPIGTWTNDYKEHLVNMINPPDEKKKPAFLLRDMKDLSDHRSVHFVVEAVEDLPADDVIEKALKLNSSMSTGNMTLFDTEGRIRQFDTANAIVDEFYTIRLQYYDKRKAYMADALSLELKRLENKVRFILAVINKELVISNRKKAVILQELRDKKYDPIPAKSAKEKTKVTNDEVVADSDDEQQDDEEKGKGKSKAKEEDQSTKDYDYLLSMPLWNLTLEKVQELERQRDTKRGELTALLAIPAKDMWNQDLDELLQALDARDAEFEEDQGKIKKKGKVKLTRRKTKGAKAKSRDDDDDDEEFSAPKSKAAAKKPSPAIPKPSAVAAKPAKPAASAKESKSNIRSFFSPTAKPKTEDSDDEENMTLEQRLAKKGKPSPFKDTKKPAADSDSDAPKKAVKRKAPAKKTDDDDEDVEEIAPPKKKPATKKKVASDDSDDDFDSKPKKAGRKPTVDEDKPKKAAKKPKATSDDEEDEEKPKKKAPAEKPKKKLAAKPKADEDSEEDKLKKKAAAKKKKDSDDDDDDDVEVVQPSTRPSRGGARKTYTAMLSDNSDDDYDDDDAASNVSLYSD